MKSKKFLISQFNWKKLFRDKFIRPKSPIWLAIAILIINGCFMISYHILVPVNSEEKIITIQKGDSTRKISQNLYEAGIIRSAFWFNAIARLTGKDRLLKSGRYVFGGNKNILETLTKLKEGKTFRLHLTFPEGLSLYKTCLIMERAGIAPKERLLKIANDRQLVRHLTGFDVPSLEGFLYPETYVFDIDLSPQQIFSIMTQEFFHRIKKANLTIEDKNNFYKQLILASIVEQEAAIEDEKPLIAGVYLNRLRKGMKLESCPTVDYVLEKQGIRRKILFLDDLKIDSPYNTYIYPDLPPTPICNPDIKSILAVLKPVKTDYLYFFADFDGKNVFSANYLEHLRKQRIYRKKEKISV